MAELAAVLAERLRRMQASAAVFESETPPCFASASSSPAKRQAEEESISPQRAKKVAFLKPSTPPRGRVRRCSLLIENAIQQQLSVASRLSSVVSQIHALSTRGQDLAESDSILVELSSLEAGFRDSLAAISAQDFQSQASDWLAVVEECCGNADARIVTKGWCLLREVFSCRRLCDHSLTWLCFNFQRSLCDILNGALTAPGTGHVSDAVEVLTALASHWPSDVETDAASSMLLANRAVLLQSLAHASVVLLAEASHIDVEGLSLLNLLAHVGDGGISQRSCQEQSCIGAGLAANMLLNSLSDFSEEHVCETVLLAAGQLATLAAQSTSSQAIEDAAAVFEGLLCHTKQGKFAALAAHIKSLRIIRALADVLLCNVHTKEGMREQVARLGIPMGQVSTGDVVLLWWILQLNPKALGVNVRTVDCALSKRLLGMCRKLGLVELLSRICLGMTSDLGCDEMGDGMAQSLSLALLIHFVRVSEDTMSRFSLCRQCFEEVGACSTDDFLDSVPQICASSPASSGDTLARSSDRPNTIIWMALHAWLPCAHDGTSARLAKQTFSVLTDTLMRMKLGSGTRQSLDVLPYADYLMRWYISTGGEFVGACDFFEVICDLYSLSQDVIAEAAQCVGLPSGLLAVGGTNAQVIQRFLKSSETQATQKTSLRRVASRRGGA